MLWNFTLLLFLTKKRSKKCLEKQNLHKKNLLRWLTSLIKKFIITFIKGEGNKKNDYKKNKKRRN